MSQPLDSNPPSEPLTSAEAESTNPPEEIYNPIRPKSAQPTDDLGIDREFWMKLLQIPLIGTGFAILGWLGTLTWGAFAPESWGLPNLGMLMVLSALMLLAAFIDGYAFKVPNWVTLSVVFSGWILGILRDFNVPVSPGPGSFIGALGCMMVGWILLYPIFLIGGMGEGDVKMQMGFGAWVGAYFGLSEGANVTLIAFCVGGIFGGICGAVMIVLRGKYRKNAENLKAIAKDLQVMATDSYTKAQERAMQRRSHWDRLPYGVPLCVGFLGYLAFKFLVLPTGP